MSKLDREFYTAAIMRSCRLVGLFIQHWAFLERQLDEAMAAALGLDTVQTVIVAANIPVSAKVQITKAAVGTAGFEPQKAKHYKRHLDKLWPLIDDRNMIVHYPFGPTDDGTATIFVVIRAKGRLQIPDTVWTEEDFESRMKRVRILDKKLVELEKDLKKSVHRAALARFFMERSPITGSGGPILADRLAPPTPKPPRSGRRAASPQITPRTPPTSEK